MKSLWRVPVFSSLVFLLASCGGGGGGRSVTPPSPPPPQPTQLRITTTAVPGGTAGQNYSASLQATGGTTPYTWSLGAGTLVSGLSLTTEFNNGVIAGVPTQADACTFTVHVQDAGSQTASGTFSMNIGASSFTIRTTAFWPATVGVPYFQTLLATGGTPPYTWSVSAPGMPSGLQLEAAPGQITGTAATTGVFTLPITARDSGHPQLSTMADLSMVLVPRAALRNDNVGDSSILPLVEAPMAFIATLSPYTDAPEVTVPDVDHYQLAAAGGSVLIIETVPPNHVSSPVDTVIEVVNGSGQRLTTCRDLADDDPAPGVPVVRDPTPDAFDDPCINDDKELGSGTDSYLEFLVPGATDTTRTFYIRVFDWHGNARPDLLYQLNVRPK